MREVRAARPPQAGGPYGVRARDWCPGKCRLVVCEFVEGGAQAFETGTKSGGIAANADPEMLRHLKEFAGDNCGLVLLAEQFEKGLRIAAR